MAIQSKDILIDYNVITGEITETALTNLQQTELDKLRENYASEKLAKQLQLQAKAELLERLGITADEAKLLLA